MPHERCGWDCRNNRIQDREVYEYATHAAVAAHPVSSSIPVRKFLVPVPRNLVGLGSPAACIDLLVSAGQRVPVSCH